MEDLIVTAERQLASGSYEAAIDTYRTASGEPGAEEAGVSGRLEAARRTRDATRGVVRPAEPPLEMPEPPPAPLPEPPVVEMTEPDLEPPAPLPPAAVDDRPIEPPSFHLIEDYPPILERPEPHSYEGPEPLSILDPNPPAEEVDSLWMARIAVAALIVIAVCVVVFLAK